jgi:hypothetical protein
MRDSYLVGPDWCELTGDEVFDPETRTTTRYHLETTPHEYRRIYYRDSTGRECYLKTPRKGMAIMARNGEEIRKALRKSRSQERTGQY